MALFFGTSLRFGLSEASDLSSALRASALNSLAVVTGLALVGQTRSWVDVENEPLCQRLPTEPNALHVRLFGRERGVDRTNVDWA